MMLIWQQLLHDADVQRLRTRDAGMLMGMALEVLSMSSRLLRRT